MSKLFNELRERLLRDGIAPRHVRRYIAELEDHLNELRAQGDSEAAALARLGTAEGLAKPMLDRREFRSWTGRLPWAVMMLGPTLTMIATGYALWFGVIQLMIFYRGIAPLPGGVWPMPLQDFVHAAAAFTALILPLMIGWAAAADRGPPALAPAVAAHRACAFRRHQRHLRDRVQLCQNAGRA